MSNKLLQIQNISKCFGRTVVLKGISFDVYEKEFLSILGPSGSGKSTLLNILTGIEKPSEGGIFYKDEALSSIPPDKRDFGVVFQGLNLFPHLNVYKNIAFSLKTNRHKKDKTTIDNKVNQLIELFKLTGLENRFPYQLSGGEKQRVAIARSLAFSPKIMILDEPFSSLDRILKEELMVEIKRLQTQFELTLLFITHDQNEASNLSDRILILKNGEIQQIGTYEDIYFKPQNQFVRSFIGYNNKIAGKIAGEDGSCFIVNVLNLFKLRVIKRTLLPIDHAVELFIRPEDVLINPSDKEGLNVIEGNIVKISKTDFTYKISVDIGGGTTWHFYHPVNCFKVNEITKLFFKIDQISYY